MRSITLLATVLLALPCGTFAQETTGRITGRVVDAQGLALPGVNVTVTGSQGSKVAVSDAEGNYAVQFLTPGTYAVRAELQGFKAAEQQNIIVALGQTVNVPLNLQVGGVTETVQVTGTSDIIDNSTTTIGQNISSEMLQRVPVGRNMASTLYLAPGVGSSGTAGANNPSIAG